MYYNLGKDASSFNNGMDLMIGFFNVIKKKRLKSNVKGLSGTLGLNKNYFVQEIMQNK